MSTIKSFDDAFDFYPADSRRPSLSRFGPHAADLLRPRSETALPRPEPTTS